MALSPENRIKHLQWALEQAAMQFRHYERQHNEKCQTCFPEAKVKAGVNGQMAAQCENAIKTSNEG